MRKVVLVDTLWLLMAEGGNVCCLVAVDKWNGEKKERMLLRLGGRALIGKRDQARTLIGWANL